MNKRFFTISISYDFGEATVSKSDNWDNYDGLIKADILKDIKCGIESLYDEALIEMRREWESNSND